MIQGPKGYLNQILDTFKVQYGLNERELEILNGLMQGQTYDEISSHVFLTRAGISYHTKSLLKKLGLEHRHQLVVKVMEWFESRQAV